MKRFLIKINGKTYDAEVEVIGASAAAPAVTPAPAAAPKAAAPAPAPAAPVAAPKADVVLDALFDSITVPGSITKEQLATIEGLTITVNAYAIQAAGFANAEEAWAA